jgi:hypothetical protein
LAPLLLDPGVMDLPFTTQGFKVTELFNEAHHAPVTLCQSPIVDDGLFKTFDDSSFRTRPIVVHPQLLKLTKPHPNDGIVTMRKVVKTVFCNSLLGFVDDKTALAPVAVDEISYVNEYQAECDANECSKEKPAILVNIR